MKKTAIYVLVVLICLCFCSCESEYRRTRASIENSVTAKLIINGEEINSEETIIDTVEEITVVPLITILNHLGAEVKWVNNRRVVILINDTKYILNPHKGTLKTREKGGTNLIMTPPGGKKRNRVCEVENKEFFINSTSASHFIYLLGYRMIVDYDNAVVTVEKIDA